MNTINTDFVRQNWQYKPEFTTADTTSLSSISNSITTNVNATYLADEIKRKLNQIYGRSAIEKMGSISFNDLEKDLKEFGIELSTIRHSSGDIGFEIEGYFNPDRYKIHRAKEMCSVPITPKTPIPKKVKFSGPATIILWEDGTKTVVKCQGDDVFNEYTGVLTCFAKKMFGNKANFNNIINKTVKMGRHQTKKEEVASSTAIEGDSYYSSALDSMKRNIDEINDFMKDAADALDKALGGKK